MLKSFRDKIALSGITVLMLGIALLTFTFISAYIFLTASLAIIASEDLATTFGVALAPLISTCIRIMYLGVMGWIGSLVTIRGVTIIAHAPATLNGVAPPQPMAEPRPQPQPQPQKPKTERPVEKPKAEKPKEEKPKEESKPPEPQFMVIPPETVSQTTPSQQQQQKEQQQTSPPQSPPQ